MLYCVLKVFSTFQMDSHFSNSHVHVAQESTVRPVMLLIWGKSCGLLRVGDVAEVKGIGGGGGVKETLYIYVYIYI